MTLHTQREECEFVQNFKPLTFYPIAKERLYTRADRRATHLLNCSFLVLRGRPANKIDPSPDEDMNIELEKSKSKPRPHKGHHSHGRGKSVKFNVGVMSPDEPTPSEVDGSKSEDQAELDEFQDAAEDPETNGDEARKPGDLPLETLPAVTNHTHVEDGESPQGKELHQSKRSEQDLPLRSKRPEGEAEAEHGRHLTIDLHAEAPLDESSDSDDSGDDYDQWNAVCVACLRVYSRDPDLTITLVEGNQGASNLIRGQEPAGATM